MRFPLPDSVADFLAYKVVAKVWHEPDEALAVAGLRPEDVDFISFDHLHVQDVRFVLGTTEPIDGEASPRAPLFPNAKLIAQRREWDTFAALHPMQWAWYVRDGIKDVPLESTSCSSTATSSWAGAWRWSGPPATPTATTRSA